jgi:uncharacterized surface protein with fasciclin (FAS1) repeats
MEGTVIRFYFYIYKNTSPPRKIMARIVSRRTSIGVKRRTTMGRRPKVAKRMSMKRNMKKRITKRRTMIGHGGMNVVDKIVENPGTFSTLKSLVIQAGLVDTLVAAQDITVFAPTNEAFAKVPQATLDNLLANPDLLTKVLTYHVVPKRIQAGDIPMGKTVIKSLSGNKLTVVNDGMSVRVNNSKVIKTDIMASNGIIHVIDTVLIPSS